MDNADKEYKYGEMFETSMQQKKLFNGLLKGMAGISVAAGSVNVFIAPDDRMTFTGIPYLGAAAMLIGSEVLNHFIDKNQDDIIELGTRSFYESDLD